MQKEFENVLINGQLLKSNTFATMRGLYVVRIYKYKDQVYFFKYKDDYLVECVNLSKG